MLIPPGEVERIVRERFKCRRSAHASFDGGDCPQCHHGAAAEDVANAILTAATAAHEKVVEQNAHALASASALLREAREALEKYAVRYFCCRVCVNITPHEDDCLLTRIDRELAKEA